jgi:cytochrome P450
MTTAGRPALLPVGTPMLYAGKITQYQQARWALSTRCLSKDPRLAWETLGYSQVAADSNEAEGSYIRNLANSDPPDHTRWRRLLAQAFTPARVKRMRPQIVSAARILADHLVAASSVDLIRSFIFPFQVMVTCDILGIPPQHRGTFRLLAAKIRTPADSPGLSETYHDAYHQMGVLITEVLATKREQIRRTSSPDLQPDLLSALITARDDSGGLTVQESQSMAMLLISAGQEPTIDLIANGMLALLLNPDQLHLFRIHPELRPRAMEELLRREAPVISIPRIAPDDLEIDGTSVCRGSVIAVMLDRAHRDPLQFPEPDAFDITRKLNAHLAFGHGIHYCIGAPLARLQSSVALTTLVERFPHISLAQSPEHLHWRAGEGTRGLAELVVTLAPSEIHSLPRSWEAPGEKVGDPRRE